MVEPTALRFRHSRSTPESDDIAGTRRETPELILDAAEAIFADSGFDGATTRAIAQAANVNPALIHYHFKSKEQLFEAVFARRSEEINARRRALLAAVMARGDEVGLEEVFVAFLRPTVELGRARSGQGRHYARIVVHVASGTDERSRRLTSARYDAIARDFIAAIENRVPGLDREAATRGYLNAVAIGLSLMAPTGRARTLSQGACSDDVDTLVEDAAAFIAAGIKALARRSADKRGQT
ncbi:MAG: TetR family transcriptional regulator [Salinarimonas sp.]|nr:TetR family transcriptional regulator [Salinarimonas sp.]